eukprot:399282-Pelagomonas_calceolata.AAC.2
MPGAVNGEKTAWGDTPFTSSKQRETHEGLVNHEWGWFEKDPRCCFPSFGPANDEDVKQMRCVSLCLCVTALQHTFTHDYGALASSS